jgi:hypothetical protein
MPSSQETQRSYIYRKIQNCPLYLHALLPGDPKVLSIVRKQNFCPIYLHALLPGDPEVASGEKTGHSMPSQVMNPALLSVKNQCYS